MALDTPDFVTRVQVAVTVENVPIVPEAATEYPIETFGRLSTSSSSLQTLKTYTVNTDRVLVLRAIELSCDNYAVAQFKITVAGETVMDTNYLPESFSKEFPDIHLSAGQVVLVQVKSDGSTTIVAYCDLNAKEVG